MARQLWMPVVRATRDLGPPDQQAHEAAVPAQILLYHCGYFMAFFKCLLELPTNPNSLGVGCDTAQRRLYVSEDKLLKLEAIVLEAADSRSILFSQVNKLSGKCTSMSAVVPPASLYAHHVYRQWLHSSAPEVTRTYQRSQYQMTEWLEARIRLDRIQWHATRHVLTITWAPTPRPKPGVA